MKRFLTSFAVALGLVASGYVAAQQPAPPPQAAPEQSVTPPSEEDIEKFADIYIDLRATAQKYEADLNEAQTPEETAEVQTKLRDESLQKLSDHGWTLDKYNMVVQAINADPALAERVVKMIDERS